MSVSSASAILDQIGQARAGLDADKPGSRERMIELAYKLAATLELPSESALRLNVAEVSLSRDAARGTVFPAAIIVYLTLLLLLC